MGRVTVVGSYIVALVIDTDRIPREGETVVGRNYHTTHGGKGSNMACCSARLGADSAFLGKVGRDVFGDGFIELLEREGVRRNGVLRSSSLPTAVGFIVTCSRGSNIIVIDPAALNEFSPADVDANAALIEESGVVLSPLEIPLETALAGARTARRFGKPSILNPAPARDLRGEDLSAVTVLTPNETEARVCLGLAPDDLAPLPELGRALLALGPRNVVISTGARGALWFSERGAVEMPALAVDVVDTVGAGDALNAGLAVGLSEKMAFDDALALGIAAASLSTRKRETIDSYAARAEVDGRIREVLGRAAAC